MSFVEIILNKKVGMMTVSIDINQVANDCMKAINEKIKNLKRLNIIVAGKTGVGKSTLINSIFREELAETGIGKPVTKHMKTLSKPDFPLTIYDTKGLEMGSDVQEEVKKEIIQTIKDGIYSKDANRAVHCMWYCINAASDRIEESEIEWLRSFTEENKETKVPVIIVLTKSFSKKTAEEFRSYIDDLNLNVEQIVTVLAKDYEIDDEYVIKAHGLDKLITVMGSVLDKELLSTLYNVQKASIAAKVKHAQGIVAATTAAGFTEGFTPVPFADAAMLIPTQVAMIASITAVFGLQINRSIITAFIYSALGTSGATITGRSVVTNLLKVIPGAGQVVGGLISGSTAALITNALGNAYIKLMESIVKGELKETDLDSETAREKLKALFLKEKETKKKSE